MEQDVDRIRRAQQGDAQAIEQLIARHRPYVILLARISYTGAVPIEDLVQEGLMGLLEGLSRFLPSHPTGASLLGYSRRWIERALKRANQRADLRYGGAQLPEDIYWAAGRMSRAERRLGADAAPEALLAEARVKRSDAPLLQAVRARRLSRLDGGLPDDDTGGGHRRAGDLPDREAPSALEAILERERRALARRAYATLPVHLQSALFRSAGRSRLTSQRERERAVLALRAAYRALEQRGPRAI